MILRSCYLVTSFSLLQTRSCTPTISTLRKRDVLLLNISQDHLSCDCLCLEECPKSYRGAWPACWLVAMRTEATNARATLGRARESQEQ